MSGFFHAIGKFFDALSYIPKVTIWTPGKNFLHHWFPNWVGALCRDGDFLCHRSGGLKRLEDVIPGIAMNGLDWMSEHPTTTGFGLVTGSAVLLTGYYCLYRGRKSQTSTSSAAPSKDRPSSKGSRCSIS